MWCYRVRTCRFYFWGIEARHKLGIGRKFIKYVWVFPVSFMKECQMLNSLHGSTFGMLQVHGMKCLRVL